MPTCPTCFAKYPAATRKCSADGADLVADATYAHVDKDPESGMTVGEYTIEAKLGEGGFGAVYSAVHPLIGKRAAVKILSRQFSSNPQMVSRFVAEARAVNQIRHRNIIDIFSFGQLPDGRQYYLMELLEGATFDAYLAKKGRLELAEALPILRGIARALDAAHAKGILHRDLKPENVFLVMDEDGHIEPKLLDFGLVKLLTDTSAHKTKTGTPMGTPYYMSPEQCRGLDVDVRTDVYAFGAMVFQILTGEVPFDGASAMDILMQHMSAPPPVPSRGGHVAAALDGPMARIMAKDAADRPPSVGAALDMLARAGGVANESSRVVVANDSGRYDLAERASARTLIADSGPPAHAGAISSPTADAPHVTLLGTESDVAATGDRQKRTRLLLAIPAVLAVAILVVGVIGRKPSPAPPSAPSVALAASPPVVTADAPPSPPPDVEVRFEGAPDDTAVSANGVELGQGRGPFKLHRGGAVKLTFAAKGYKPKEMTVIPSENMVVPVTLEKLATTSGAGRPPPQGSAVHIDLEGFDKK